MWRWWNSDCWDAFSIRLFRYGKFMCTELAENYGNLVALEIVCARVVLLENIIDRSRAIFLDSDLDSFYLFEDDFLYELISSKLYFTLGPLSRKLLNLHISHFLLLRRLDSSAKLIVHTADQKFGIAYQLKPHCTINFYRFKVNICICEPLWLTVPNWRQIILNNYPLI